MIFINKKQNVEHNSDFICLTYNILMANKCLCETAKEDIEKAYKNPNPYHGVLQDIMDAEIEYANMCAIWPCRKRRLERQVPVEPENKRKEVES